MFSLMMWRSLIPVVTQLTGELSINHLLYADDMAILLLSGHGLQNSLYKLKVYCYKWHIELNTTKTTIIVFSTTGRLLKRYRFSYNGKILEQVREFKYLGTTFSGSGSLICAKEKLQKQANKAYFPMLKALQLQICRNILGVSKETSVLASLGELGCYSLLLSCCVHMVKY